MIITLHITHVKNLHISYLRFKDTIETSITQKHNPYDVPSVGHAQCIKNPSHFIHSCYSDNLYIYRTTIYFYQHDDLIDN